MQHVAAERPSAVIVANQHAGGGRGARIARESRVALENAGISTTLVQPASLAAMKAALGEACADPDTFLIACGGDGTVHQVLQAAMASSMRMGIIPAGTGNDIARALGIDVKARSAWLRIMAERMLANEATPVDVTQISLGEEQVWSLGVVSTGFDSAVNERADRMTRLRGTARYVAALLGELRTFALHDYQVTIDEDRYAGSALLIAIGNGSSYGGGMLICPHADMADGLLDVTWVAAAPRRTVLRFFPRIFRGTHVDHPLVTTYRAREITVAADGAIVYADGERIGPPPVHVRVRAGALRILRP